MFVGVLYLAAQLCGHGLHTVTDAQYRHTQFEQQRRRNRRIATGHCLGPAGQYHAVGMKHAPRVLVHVIGMNLTLHPDFTHPARNQLRVLGTEVQDEDSVGMDILLRHGLQRLLRDNQKR
jgi:hypothetical protein